MVRKRAKDFFSCLLFLIASTSPSSNLKFKRKSDSFRRASSACRSSSCMSRYLSTSSRLFMAHSVRQTLVCHRVDKLKLVLLNRASLLLSAGYKLGPDRQFL